MSQLPPEQTYTRKRKDCFLITGWENRFPEGWGNCATRGYKEALSLAQKSRLLVPGDSGVASEVQTRRGPGPFTTWTWRCSFPHKRRPEAGKPQCGLTLRALGVCPGFSLRSQEEKMRGRVSHTMAGSHCDPRPVCVGAGGGAWGR